MADLKRDWHVIYTKSRNEKKVAENLQTGGYQVYCPTVTTLKQWSDRKKKVSEPLFKSYIFVRSNELERLEIVKTPGVVCFLHWLNKPAIVREEEISAIRQFTQEVEGIGTTEVSFEEGDLVSIDWGIFKGQDGEYLARQGDNLILLVESLGRVIRAVVPAAHVVC